MTHDITILAAQQTDCRAVKTYQCMADGRIKETPYNSGRYFKPIPCPVDDLDDLYALLQLLESHENCMLVRGEVLPKYAQSERITRTLHDDPSKGQKAMIQPFAGGEPWLIIDFDKQPLATGLSAADGVEHLVQQLPAEFRTASYCYQLSSSAGVTGEKWDDDPEAAVECYPGWSVISAHVFFWLSQPVQGLAQWGKNFNAVRGGQRLFDPSVLETVQPNYTARPVFVNMADPVGAQRSGLVRKDHAAVDLQWIDRPVQYVAVDGQDYRVGATVIRDGQATIATPSLQDRFDAIGGWEGHREPLKKAIHYYFWYHGRDGTADEIKRLLHEQFPCGIKDYLTDGKLDPMLRWFAARMTHPPVYQDKKDADALLARMVAWKASTPPLPDKQLDYEERLFDMDDTGLQCHFIGDECGRPIVMLN